jgi:hypothetical protein
MRMRMRKRRRRRRGWRLCARSHVAGPKREWSMEQKAVPTFLQT